ncbi:MAG: NAD(P)-dependent oxidoreductase [Planctomycetota bacterium]
MKVLVTGASGFVGGHLVQKLLEKKYEVFCICRKTSNLKHLETLSYPPERVPRIGFTNLKFVTADLSNTSYNNTLKEVLKEVDYIYHLAGVIKAYSAEDYDKGNFGATRYFIEAVDNAKNKNLKRFLHLSSLAAAGPADDTKGISEESYCHPVSDYGKSKLKGENVVSGYKDSLPVTILRPPVVYGPRDSGLLFFFKIISYGIKPQFNPKKHISLIYVKDLVDAMILSAENPQSIGQTYFVANKDSYSINSIVDAISKVVNNNAVNIRLSDGVIQKVAGVYEGFYYLLGLEPTMINSQKALELSQDYWTCQTKKIKMSIGFQTSVSLEAGVQETADCYLKNKWIRDCRR